MNSKTLLYLALVLFLTVPASAMAVSIGDENATLVSTENYTIVPTGTIQPYTVHQNSALGALHAISLKDGVNYTVTNVMPAERGYLHVASIEDIGDGTENETSVSWAYWVNGEMMTAGPAQKQVFSGDTVTYSYGPANHTLAEAEYTLNISVTVTEAADQAETMAMSNVTGNQTTENATGNQTMNQTQNMTVVDLIGQQQNLTMLSDALATANLTGTLSTGGPYTVFAPDNEAFGDLGNDTANLTAILQYHVVEGNYTSQQLTEMLQQNMTDNQTTNQTENMTENQTANQTQNMTGNQTLNQTENMTQQQAAIMLQTLLGENLTVSESQSTGQLMVNNASVVQPDINASNGIIHVIDKVLMPENLTANSQNESPGASPGSLQTTITGSSSSLTVINKTD